MYAVYGFNYVVVPRNHRSVSLLITGVVTAIVN